MLPKALNGNLVFSGSVPNYLTENQLNNLIATFQDWYDDKSISDTKRRIRGRYWLVFLTLRFTGARISEVINIKHEDIDFRNAEIVKRLPKLHHYALQKCTIPSPLLSLKS